jgi:dTDP-4-dehydrorhamnose 3,5-epimerase
MPFRFRPLDLPGLVLIEPDVAPDRRGVFLELYRSSTFADAGLPNFVQDNLSRSVRGTLRGLHYQRPPSAQGKLIAVLMGEVFDVAVDLRGRSRSFGQWTGLTLSEGDARMLFIPAGFAHGFCVLSERAAVLYKVTAEYAPEREAGIVWDDPHLGVRWPVADPILSDRDARLPAFSAVTNDFADWSA